jgi:unsaturated rhamnogalacturonyl hydrolase
MPSNVIRLLLCSFCLPALTARAAQPTTTAATQPARAFARFVPEAFDDVAWENDRIAFRAYGPALEGQQKTGSGIDVWVKSTRKLVIDRWYKAGDYLHDHGEGLDCYSVGQGRGCGGLAIWNGKTLDVSRVWKSHKIIRSGPDEAVIELSYAPWAAGDRKVWEIRRITLKAGSNLNRMESTIDSDKPDPLTVGIGINQRNAEGGEATLDKRKGMIAYWEPPQNENGSVACGVLVDPATLVRLSNADHHFLALLTVMPGKPFVYYAGAGWSKSGDFPNPLTWETYLREYATDFAPAKAPEASTSGR